MKEILKDARSEFSRAASISTDVIDKKTLKSKGFLLVSGNNFYSHGKGLSMSDQPAPHTD